jgi:hypothetical protein
MPVLDMYSRDGKWIGTKEMGESRYRGVSTERLAKKRKVKPPTFNGYRYEVFAGGRCVARIWAAGTDDALFFARRMFKTSLADTSVTVALSPIQFPRFGDIR